MRETEPITLWEQVLNWAEEDYGTDPEYPWESTPEAAVLRRRDNKKWYGLLMRVRRNRLGLPGDSVVEILNVKADPELSRSTGILPAYHMNKQHWVSVLLDGTAEPELVRFLLDRSYTLAGGKSKKRDQQRIDRWLVPANPHFYDIEKAIAESSDRSFLWKQSSAVQRGDQVYIYVGAPTCAIRYLCRAVETDIPYQYEDKNVHMSHVMRLHLLCRFDGPPLNRDLMKRHGVVTVRGPRGMPEGLVREIEKLYPSPQEND